MRRIETSIIKTFRFNLFYFGIKGVIKPSVLISRNVKLANLKGSVEVKKKDVGIIKIGYYYVGTEDIKYNRAIWNNTGKVIFEGEAKLGSGTKIANSGELCFGENFIITSNSTIISTQKITFGKNCLVSWECLFMDTDFHKIYDIRSDNKSQLNTCKPVIIGDDVWFGCRTTILKGTNVANKIIVAASSVLHGKYNQENVIIDGKRILRDNVNWED